MFQFQFKNRLLIIPRTKFAHLGKSLIDGKRHY